MLNLVAFLISFDYFCNYKFQNKLIISNTHNEILQLSLSHLSEFSGWEAIWIESQAKGIDGRLRLERDGKTVELDAKVKSVLQAGQLPTLLDKKKAYGTFLIVAGRISQQLMTKLKNLRINYLESGGNAFVDTGDLFLLIEGKKGGLSLKRKHLFTNASIKLLFYLMLKPELLKQTYREIADITNASLDNISKTIRTLKDNDYLIALKEGGYVFTNKEKLLERWIPEYGERLKPKLFMERYRFLKNEQWKEIPLDPQKTKWGGEPAADKMLGALRPEIFTLYTLESKQELIQRYHLIPDRKGNVYVYQAFWASQAFDHKEITPDLLIYADLLLSGSARNAEVAKTLIDARKEFIF